MTAPADFDEKPSASTTLIAAASWTGLAVEHHRMVPGAHHRTPQMSTELTYILSGRSAIKRLSEGKMQQGLALPGTSWLAPAGAGEGLLEFGGEVECLIVKLAPQLLDDGAMLDHDIDPSRTQLVQGGGFADPAMSQICMAIRSLLGRPSQPVDRLFAEGLRTALTAHLLGNYTIDRWQAPQRQPVLEQRRLQRVLSYVEEKLGENISLDDLASEACLSPFHFARLFQQATGRPPHRYVVERRVAAAQEQLRRGRSSMAELALDTGFGTQANFSRVFRKLTGLTPRQYRDIHVN